MSHVAATSRQAYLFLPDRKITGQKLAILECLVAAGPLTRLQIAEATGLGINAVTGRVGDHPHGLIAMGLAQTCGRICINNDPRRPSYVLSATGAGLEYIRNGGPIAVADQDPRTRPTHPPNVPSPDATMGPDLADCPGRAGPPSTDQGGRGGRIFSPGPGGPPPRGPRTPSPAAPSLFDTGTPPRAPDQNRRPDGRLSSRRRRTAP